MNLKETAEYYRVGVLVGFVRMADAIAWTDSVIAAEDDPDIALIEASMCGHKRPEDFASALAQLAGVANRNTVIQRLLKSMYDAVVQDKSQAQHIAHCLYMMAIEGYAPDQEAQSYMMGIEDELYLVEGAAPKYIQKVVEELINFLRPYALSD
jgi:hypothetical protein